MKVMFLVPSGTQRSLARFRVVPMVEWGRKNDIDVSYKVVPRNRLARYAFFSRLPHVDVFVVHRELFSSYELASLRRLCKTLVYDFADAVWTLPDRELKRFGSGAKVAKLARRFERVCREADMCIVDNRSLAERISEYQEHVRIIPTSVDTERYSPGCGGKDGGATLVGWLGTPGNEVYLDDVMRLLESHAGAIQFSVVSGPQYVGPGREYVFWSSWSEEAEPVKLQAMDIGLMSVADDEFMRVGSGIDVLKYMASGVAVVASNVGGNAEIVDHGIDGFLVRDHEDWARHVMRLAEGHALRQQMIEAARRKVVEKYSLDSVAPQFWDAVGN